jgi:hypothetical protein
MDGLAADFGTETGTLFSLATRLMLCHTSSHGSLDRVCILFGRYLQTRDDYQNLMSSEVSLPTVRKVALSIEHKYDHDVVPQTERFLRRPGQWSLHISPDPTH